MGKLLSPSRRRACIDLIRSHTQLGLTGIPCLEGLLEGGAQEWLQCLGVGPAVDPSVVGIVGVLNLGGHDVSFLGRLPWFG